MSTRRLGRILSVWSIAGGAGAALALAQWALGLDIGVITKVLPLAVNGNTDVNTRSEFLRVSGGTAHPIEFSVLTAIALPIAIWCVTQTRGATRIVHFAAAGLMATALPLAVSRSAVLAAGVAVILAAFGWSKRVRVNVVILGIAFVVLFRAVSPGVLGTVASLFRNASTDPSVTARTEDYAEISELWLGSPVIGIGIGTYRPEVYRFLDNQALLTVVEQGVLGLVAWLAAIVCAVLLCRRARRAVPGNASVKSLAWALTGGVGALSFSTLTYDTFSFTQSLSATMLMLGICAAFDRVVRMAAPHDGQAATRRLAPTRTAGR
ncbi:O-antigen ligase family protein [Aquipuribacter nitratireducens]|uniref:O-antigen ligase family protein n=1 Tax=Aquipuribacter nitratireducens TaxID=650104 RepID=A0ABW0GPR0_9MICO